MSVVENVAILKNSVSIFNRTDDRSTYFELYASIVVTHGIHPVDHPTRHLSRTSIASSGLLFPTESLKSWTRSGKAIRSHAGTHKGELMGIAAAEKHVK